MSVVFIRRGSVVKGPISLEALRALVNKGRALPSDEYAASADGPWRKIGSLGGRSTADVLVIELFQIKQGVFNRGFYAEYHCMRCGESLQSNESEMGQIESCPRCGIRFRLSSRAREQIKSTRAEHERQHAAIAAAAAEDRKQRLAVRQAEAARREAGQRQLNEMQATQAAEDAASQQRQLERAAAARQRSDACWYCGLEYLTSLRLCLACGMLIRQ